MNNWDKLAGTLQEYELTRLRDNIYSRMENCKNLKWKITEVIHDSAKEWVESNPHSQSEIVMQIIETTKTNLTYKQN